MTTPDIAGLCERLRAVESSREPSDWSGIRQVTTNWHRNPDGPEAADTLERQAAEIERLRTGLEKVAAYYETGALRFRFLAASINKALAKGSSLTA
jgi:hypothetical protein